MRGLNHGFRDRSRSEEAGASFRVDGSQHRALQSPDTGRCSEQCLKNQRKLKPFRHIYLFQLVDVLCNMISYYDKHIEQRCSSNRCYKLTFIYGTPTAHQVIYL